MRFLVLGASGMAGHLISMYLYEQGHSVDGFSRHEIRYVNWIKGDVRDLDTLHDTINKGCYDTVINAVGILNQAAENDKENAVFVNAYLPHYIAKITEKCETQIIHMSTDCVFSGKNGGYTEYSLRDGETFYDRTKALGELEDEKNVTFRNSIIGPDMNPGGIGLLNWFLQQKSEIRGYIHARWTGLTTLELSKAIEQAAQDKVHGLYNLVYRESISKYDLLQICNQIFRNSSISIVPSEEVNVDKTLKRTNFDFKYKIPEYRVMITELYQWMEQHRQLYPHYYT